MTRRSDWQPLLEGALAEQAWGAVYDVAAALRQRVEVESAARAISPCLSKGKAGFAVFFSYLAAARPDGVERDLAFDCLNQAIDGVAMMPPRPAFYTGFPGVGWAIEHLEGRLFDADEGESDRHEEIDDMIHGLLSRSEWRRPFDLISGLVGLGIYILEGLHRPLLQEALGLLLGHLEALSERTSEGVTWLSPPRHLPPHQIEFCPQGHYNLGLAHGVPGIVAFLGRVCETGLYEDRARPLLEGAVAWLLSQEAPPDAPFRFGSWTCAETRRTTSRLAWCYGDPGVAAAMVLAARCARQPGWEKASLRVARAAANHSSETSGVKDMGLCHGSAGLGQIFNRLYQATGEEIFATAARRWFRITLEMRLPEYDVAGFPTWAPAPSGDFGWHSDPGILPGATGVALALLAAVSSVEPEWDRILLISIPPRELAARDAKPARD